MLKSQLIKNLLKYDKDKLGISEFLLNKNIKQMQEIIDFIKEYSTFNNAFQQLTEKQQKNLVWNMQLVEFQPNQIIFQRGDLADYFYIIVQGEVIIYDYDLLQQMKIINRLGPVNSFAEKAFENAEKKRTLSAKAYDSGTVQCIRVSGQIYQNFLGTYIALQKEYLIKVLDDCLPQMKTIKKHEKYQYIYFFAQINFNKGQTIIYQMQRCDKLYFICKGECKYCEDDGDGRELKCIRILGEGSFFGDQGAFFGQNNKYSVRVLSDKCNLIYI